MIKNLIFSSLKATLLKKAFASCAIFYLALLLVILHTYFPPSTISIQWNDQFDSYFPYFGIFPDFKELFLDLDEIVKNQYGGLSPNAAGLTEFSVVRIVASLFPKYWEFSVYYLVYISALFLSSYILFVFVGRTKIISVDESKMSTFIGYGFAAFIFSLFPHNAFVIGSIIGFNLFVAATLLAIQNGKIAVIVCLFVLAGLFDRIALAGYAYIPIITILVGIGVWRFGVSQRVLYLVLCGVLIEFAFEYRLIADFLLGTDVSHRDNWYEGQTYSLLKLFSLEQWKGTWAVFIEYFKGKTPHVHYSWNFGGISVKVTGVLLGLSLFIVTIRLALRKQFINSAINLDSGARIVLFSSIFMIVAVFGHAVLYSGTLDLSRMLQISFQFDRLIFAVPILMAGIILGTWFLFVGLAGISQRPFLQLFLVVFICWIITPKLHEPLTRKNANLQHYEKNGPDNPFIPMYNVETVFGDQLYKNIIEFLGPLWKNERVVSIGSDPMVTAYHGFGSLDGYYSNYPEEYQQKFLAVIAPAFPELDQQSVTYYTNWGNRLNVPIIKTNNDSSINIQIDHCAFLELGGTLVISAAKIANPEESWLELVEKIEDNSRNTTAKRFLYRPKGSDICVISSD